MLLGFKYMILPIDRLQKRCVQWPSVEACIRRQQLGGKESILVSCAGACTQES